MSADWATLHGIHGPNAPLAQWSALRDRRPAQPIAGWWGRVRQTRAAWIKLMAEHHTPADAAVATGWGLKVILRLPGEGIVSHKDVTAAIFAYQGACSVIEIGNEPITTGMPAWQHAFYLEEIARVCKPAATAAGIALCTPGWQANLGPPGATAEELDQRLLAVYTQYDWIGYHDYDPNSLTTAAHQARLRAWGATFPSKALLITEYGIADRVLPGCPDEAASDLAKVVRYTDFLATVGWVPAVQGACAFIGGGSDTWAAFNDAAQGWQAQGRNRYWLSEEAWGLFGRLAAAPGTTRGSMLR